MLTTLALVLFASALFFVLGFAIGDAWHLTRPSDVRSDPPGPASVASSPPLAPLTSVAFEVIAPRGCRGLTLSDHAPEWRAAMRDVGARLRAADVSAIVFVHGTFTGSDPLSAVRAVERALPRRAAVPIANALRRVTRTTVDRLLGDLGQFNAGYTELFEQAINDDEAAHAAPIACTSFGWSSENHHVGRVEGALGLLRVLATHREIGHGRLLVLGHSHAGQVFALVTQMLASALTTEAVRDVARARRLDVAAYDADRLALAAAPIDFVTFGAPVRYSWAAGDLVRALHVVSGNGDLVQRLGASGSDFPPIDPGDRRVNASLEAALGASFAPKSALRALLEPPSQADRNVVLVDYGDARLVDRIGSGLGHGGYTRLDGMLFHADLLTRLLYTDAAETASAQPPDSRCARRILAYRTEASADAR